MLLQIVTMESVDEYVNQFLVLRFNELDVTRVNYRLYHCRPRQPQRQWKPLHQGTSTCASISQQASIIALSGNLVYIIGYKFFIFENVKRYNIHTSIRT
jgi:hypothetical protein